MKKYRASIVHKLATKLLFYYFRILLLCRLFRGWFKKVNKDDIYLNLSDKLDRHIYNVKSKLWTMSLRGRTVDVEFVNSTDSKIEE